MDALAIFALVAKGISVISALISAEQSAEPALKAIADLVTGAQKGGVSQADLDKTEVLLDSLIDDFNLELPPA
jgi:hypothetical protein